MTHAGGSVEDRRALHQWFSRVPGRLILESEVGLFDYKLPDLFGYQLLQVGHLCGADMLSASRVLNRSIVDIDGMLFASPYPVIRAAADLLPVASDSVDVVLLPHVLEFVERPHEALREAQRVLVPEGHLLISGFNPWSFMGVWRLVLGRRRAVPWCGRFLAINRIRDWLALLGFDVVGLNARFYRPPFGNEQVMQRLQFLDRVGARVGGLMAGAYLLVARKRVSTLTPIKPRWTGQRRLASVGLVGPTGRVARGCVPRAPRYAQEATPLMALKRMSAQTRGR